MDELAELMVSALRPYTNTTYSIFGHSMGALLGYEIAMRLKKSGARRACKLFASGSRAPFVTNPVAPISHLPDVDFLEHLRRLDGTPEKVLRERDLMDLLIPVIRADFTVGEKYRGENNDPLDLPVTVFSGDEDKHASVDDMLLWRSVTHGAFRSYRLPGGHFFVNEQPESIVQLIGDELISCCGEDLAVREGIL
jgi:surfactin synthase thioesterase subunit